MPGSASRRELLNKLTIVELRKICKKYKIPIFASETKTGIISKMMREMSTSDIKYETSGKSKTSGSSSRKISSKCSKDKIVNPATGRCVSKTGVIGRKLLGK